MAFIWLLAGLALASPARAEVVAPTAGPALLAVAPDGSPRVAYVSGRDLLLARRAAAGWKVTRLGRLPGTRAVLAGLVVDGRGRSTVLAEQERGAWLALSQTGGRLQVVARPRKGASLGPAGLTLDHLGRPAFAYALWLANEKTWLRLVTIDAPGRLRTHGITKGGFPASSLVPGAAPVLVRGRLHVVETYTSAAIDWGPKSQGGWEGQFLFSSASGTPQGPVGAVFLSSTLWSAWTQLSPQESPNDIVVLLTSSADTQVTWTLTHGIFVSVANGETAPEVAAYDWVQPAADAFAYAGLVLQGPGGPAWQLDGRLEGFAVGGDGSRQLLLSRDGKLEWFRSPGPLPPIRLGLGLTEQGHVDGTVPGVTSGTVQLYREVPHAARELVATLPIQPDSSFAAEGLDPTALYRAVYVDPATGIPFSFLPGVPVGSSAG